MTSLCAVLAAVWIAEAAAATKLYTLEIPDGDAVRYEVEVPVEHSGTLEVHASWTGVRHLGFKLEPPVAWGSTLRRTGASPQHLAVDVSENQRGTWLLSIRALPARGAGEGRLTIELPEQRQLRPQAAAPQGDILAAAAVRQTRQEPWQQPRAPQYGLPEDRKVVFRTVEALRTLVVDGNSPPDSCRWQEELLQELALRRDALLDAGERPSIDTRKMYVRIAAAVRRVDELRTSDDPVLAGPPPRDRKLRDAWLRLHHSRLQPLEDELDDLLQAVQRGHAPELDQQEWPVRLISCVIACQQHFEQRARVGESRAANLELARAQWQRILAAAAALEGLGVVPENPIRLRR